MDARTPLPLGLLLVASAVASVLPFCNTTYGTSYAWVQKGATRILSCPLCRSGSPCYWGAFNNQCELQEDLNCSKFSCSVTINSNADAKRQYCCSNQSSSLPQRCFAVNMCAYVISAAPEREVYVEYQSTITVVLGGYPLPVQYSNIFCTVDSVSFPSGAAPVMAVPPDEANVTFSYPISASSTSPSTCIVYYRNSDTHCTDISVSIGIFPAILQASGNDGHSVSFSSNIIAVSPSPGVVSPSPGVVGVVIMSPQNTFTSGPTEVWSPYSSQLPWETSLPLTSVLTNGRVVTTMAGLSTAIMLAAILLIVLIMVCIKLEAYDILFPSKKNGNRFIVQNQRTSSSEGSTPLTTPTDEAIRGFQTSSC